MLVISENAERKIKRKIVTRFLGHPCADETASGKHVTSDVHESQQPYSSRDVNPAVVTDFVSP